MQQQHVLELGEGCPAVHQRWQLLLPAIWNKPPEKQQLQLVRRFCAARCAEWRPACCWQQLAQHRIWGPWPAPPTKGTRPRPPPCRSLSTCLHCKSALHSFEWQPRARGKVSDRRVWAGCGARDARQPWLLAAQLEELNGEANRCAPSVVALRRPSGSLLCGSTLRSPSSSADLNSRD